MCPHTSPPARSLLYTCVPILRYICVPILYMCPHTPPPARFLIYWSPYYDMCVLILRYMCPHATLCVLSCICSRLILPHVSSDCDVSVLILLYIRVLILRYMCPQLHTSPPHTVTCVLRLRCMCPHTALYTCPHATIYFSSYYSMYVSSHHDVCVLIILCMCPHTRMYLSSCYCTRPVGGPAASACVSLCQHISADIR